MYKKLMVLVLVCILIFPLGLTAKEKRGANLIVQYKDGQTVRGELITIKQNSLLLSDEGSGVSVDVHEIKVITIVKKSKAGKGALYGFGLGATGGAIAGFLVDPEEEEYRVGHAIFGGIFLGAIGALTGLTVGGFLGRDKTIQIEGSTDSEIHETLEYLRKKARIPDYN